MNIVKNSRWYARTLARLQRQLRDAARRPHPSPTVRQHRLAHCEQRILLFKLRWGELAPAA